MLYLRYSFVDSRKKRIKDTKIAKGTKVMEATTARALKTEA